MLQCFHAPTLERKLGGLDGVTADETIDVHDVAGVYEAIWLQSMRSKVPRRRRQSVQRTISIVGAWNVSAEVKGGKGLGCQGICTTP
jgi:hypothetical protein